MGTRPIPFFAWAFLGIVVLFPGKVLSPAEAGQSGNQRVGTLDGAGFHNAEGSVKLTGHRLVLSDIEVDRVPDGRVYLANDAAVESGVELGKLSLFSGTVHYAIPSGINPDDYNSVLIWCKKFDVDIGYASPKE